MKTLEIVTSVDEMTDKSKPYAMNGTVWKYEARYDVLVPVNEIPKSTNSDGTPYNNGKGWKTGYYVGAGNGKETVNAEYECTGFIPVTYTDIFRIANYTSNGTAYDNIVFFDSSFAVIGAFTDNSNYNPLSQFKKDDGTMEVCINTAGTTNFTSANKKKIAYMRLSFAKITNNTTCIVNVFEESTELKDVSWYDTKLPYYGEAIQSQGGIIEKLKRYMGLHK